MVHKILVSAICLFLLHDLKAQQSSFGAKNDSLSIKGMELVVRNSTQHVSGYLYNVLNGKTQFRPLGNAIQFAVGTGNAPQAGDSIYTNPRLKGSHIKIWRNGQLLCGNCPAAPLIDTSLGKIIFRPALVQSEKLYIEALYFIDHPLQP